MPDRGTVIRWMDQEPDFAAKYARAREVQADAMDDLILETAEKTTPENAAANRVKIDAYKWRAAKLKPKVYGDKVQTELSGSMTVRSERQLSDEELAAIAAKG